MNIGLIDKFKYDYSIRKKILLVHIFGILCLAIIGWFSYSKMDQALLDHGKLEVGRALESMSSQMLMNLDHVAKEIGNLAQIRIAQKWPDYYLMSSILGDEMALSAKLGDVLYDKENPYWFVHRPGMVYHFYNPDYRWLFGAYGLPGQIHLEMAKGNCYLKVDDFQNYASPSLQKEIQIAKQKNGIMDCSWSPKKNILSHEYLSILSPIMNGRQVLGYLRVYMPLQSLLEYSDFSEISSLLVQAHHFLTQPDITLGQMNNLDRTEYYSLQQSIVENIFSGQNTSLIQLLPLSGAIMGVTMLSFYEHGFNNTSNSNKKNELLSNYSDHDMHENYLLLVHFSKHELFSEFYSIIYTVLALLAILALLLSWVLLFISNQLIEPIRLLSKTTNRLANGDLTAQTTISADDEIGRLGRSVNVMAQSLRNMLVSKEYVDKIIESILDSILVIDRNGMVQRANQAALSQLKDQERPIIGRSIFDSVKIVKFEPMGLETYFYQNDLDYEAIDAILSHDNYSSPKGATRAVSNYLAKNILLNKRIKDLRLQIENFSGERISLTISCGLIMEEQKATGIVLIAKDLLPILELQRRENEKLEKLANAYRELDETQKVGLSILEDLELEIHERKAAESQLQLHSAALESAANAIVLTDNRGVITWSNKAVSQLTGFAREEVIGKTPRIFKSNQHEPEYYQQMWQTIMAGQVWQGEIVNRKKDGSRYVEEQTITPVRDDNDHIRNFIAIKQDITARKEIERHTRKAKEMAEAANRSKSEFLANMSHEIRTPLTAILGMADILLDSQLDGEQKRYLSIIRSSGDILIHIINEILDFAKIESGKVIIEHLPFHLCHTVNSVMESFFAMAKEKSLDMEVDIDPDLPQQFLGDSFRIKQILINFLSNAIKFTRKGFIHLFIDMVAPTALSRQASLKQTIGIRFRVRDSGIGIAPEKKEDIFKMFVQGDTSSTREFGGTGLGLTISRKLIELMGSKIEIKSPIYPKSQDTGPGTEFMFTLHLEPVTTQFSLAKQYDLSENKLLSNSSSNNSLNLASSIASENSEKPFRILVAEDNKVNQMMIMTMLRKMGYEVEIAKDGLEAIRMLEGSQYNMVFMDIHMPNLDGFEATQIIKHSEFSAIPIVALTANAYKEVLGRCLRIGMDEYIVKPYDRDRIQQVIEGIQNRYQGRLFGGGR